MRPGRAVGLHGYQTADGLRLSLRIGVGAGEVMALRVGGVGGRWELLLSGEPLVQMRPGRAAGGPGEVVLSPHAWELARDGCTGERLADGGVRLLTASISMGTRAPVARRPEDSATTRCCAYVPGAVRARLAAGQTDWLAELRRVTAVFVNLPDVDPAAAGLLEPVQLAMAAIQPILHRYEGSINKLIVDDKGVTLIAALGLPLLAHEDDPARATRAALGCRRRCGTGLRMRHRRGHRPGFCGAVGSTCTANTT